ncbi:MAG: Gfo/Idh/MocA family oxidoreductase [Rhodospirillaceae bacterium]|jgi:predicted dehydrogenase|nr:Gfo/Idh/MocA family oxidoreductase [Rhodospirillaceae bacterium]MBT6117646.1 Gfo/Idh/MocA family oxidoreductase [Rhodospirillaceae bacterium]
MTAQAYKAAVIGCGRIGSLFDEQGPDDDTYTHAGAFHRHERTALAAVCDIDAERAQEAARHWQAGAWYTDPQAMLDAAAPEIVGICTPDALHAALTADALAAPKTLGILCEKPIATTVADGEAMAAQAALRGVILSVNHIRRFDHGHKRAVALVHDGGLGEIQSVVGRYSGGLRHNGSHMFDLLRWLFGEPATVLAEDRLGEGGEDPSLDVTLRYGDGLQAAMLGHRAAAFHIFELDVIGTNGRLRFEAAGHSILHERVENSARWSRVRELGAGRALSTAMRDTTFHAIDDLVSVLDGIRPHPACTAGDGLAALALAERALRTAQRGAVPEELPA